MSVIRLLYAQNLGNFLFYLVSMTMTGPQAVEQDVPDGVGYCVFRAPGSLLSDSSWIARRAAVMVPAPAQAPNKMTGFIFRTWWPNNSDTRCGRSATKNATTTRLGPVSRRPATNVGPAFESDDTDEHRKANGVEDPERRLGVLPNVGCTERSQPNTRPMRSAPPLVVSVRGSPPIVERQQPDEAADDDAQAEEHDVRFTRWTLDVAQLPSDALHVPLGAGERGAGRPD